MNHKIKILADATLPSLKEAFPCHFELSFYDKNPFDKLTGQDILLCRSTLQVDKTLLSNSSIRIVATASSGVDHIDEPYLKSRNIRLMNAVGANAVAVADYIMAVVAHLSQEKIFQGNKIGIIGMGFVGKEVALRFKALNFDLVFYDPYLLQYQNNLFEDLYHCDLITVHANLHDNLPYPSRHLLNQDFFAKLKPNTVVINAARGELVDEEALLACNRAFLYCTDVYAQEPHIRRDLIQRAIVATPHIAGHSIEAKIRAVYVLSEKIHQFFKLSPPNFDFLKKTLTVLPLDKIGALYNPSHETLVLKEALDLSKAFLELRKAHLRHEF